MSKEEAMTKYIDLVSRVDPEWETQELDTSQQVRETAYFYIKLCH